jgi:NAD(P)-dependent dehydrogenase (short-subunit alcohol dehydrogenase family)
VFYAHTLADDGLKVNALAPGLRRTDLNASAGPPIQPSRLTLSTRSSSSPRGPGPIGEVAQLAGHGRKE